MPNLGSIVFQFFPFVSENQWAGNQVYAKHRAGKYLFLDVFSVLSFSIFAEFRCGNFGSRSTHRRAGEYRGIYELWYVQNWVPPRDSRRSPKVNAWKLLLYFLPNSMPASKRWLSFQTFSGFINPVTRIVHFINSVYKMIGKGRRDQSKGDACLRFFQSLL